jgi:hypothetical protein
MFEPFDVKKTDPLFLVRQGWLNQQYDLTDNTFSYGNMAYSGLLRRKATIKTAKSAWVLNWLGPFNLAINITNESGIIVGTATRSWFSQTVTLNLQTGFRAQFHKPSFWSGEYAWMSDGCGKILQITSNLFIVKDVVTINNSMVPVAIIPLLIFLGEHLIILRRRR